MIRYGFASKIVVNILLMTNKKSENLVRKETITGLRKDKDQNRNIFMLLLCTNTMFLLIPFFYCLVINCSFMY